MASVTQFPRRLTRNLQQLEGRGNVIVTVAAVCWGLTGSVVTLLLCAWLDLLWEWSAALRMIAWPLALVVGLITTAGVMVTARRHYRRRDIARRMDRAGVTGGEVLSGYDLELA